MSPASLPAFPVCRPIDAVHPAASSWAAVSPWAAASVLLLPLPCAAGAQQSVNLPLEQLAALQYMQTLTGSGVEEEPAPTVGFGGWRGIGGFGTGAGPSASPFTAAPGTGNLSLTSGQLPVITELRLSAGRRSYDKRRSLDKRRSGKGMQQSTMLDTVAEGPEREAGEAAASTEAPAAVEGEDAGSVADSEDSLVEELAEQAKEEAGQQRVVSGALLGCGPTCLPACPPSCSMRQWPPAPACAPRPRAPPPTQPHPPGGSRSHQASSACLRCTCCSGLPLALRTAACWASSQHAAIPLTSCCVAAHRR